MTKSIAQEIMNNVKDINNLIPHINAGGCGVFACLFAEKMNELGYDAKVIELTMLHPDLFSLMFGHNPNYFKEHHQANITNIHKAEVRNLRPDTLDISMSDHYCVKIDTFFFDSTMFYETSEDTVLLDKDEISSEEFSCLGEIPLPEMEYVSLKNRGNLWNDDYNPSNNEKMKQFIDNALNFLQ